MSMKENRVTFHQPRSFKATIPLWLFIVFNGYPIYKSFDSLPCLRNLADKSLIALLRKVLPVEK